METRFSSDGKRILQVTYLDSPITAEDELKVRKAIKFFPNVVPIANVEEIENKTIEELKTAWNWFESIKDRKPYRGVVSVFLYRINEDGTVIFNGKTLPIPKDTMITPKGAITLASLSFLYDYIENGLDSEDESSKFEKELMSILLILSALDQLIKLEDIGIELQAFGVGDADTKASKDIFVVGSPIGTINLFRFSPNVTADEVIEEARSVVPEMLYMDFKNKFYKDIEEYLANKPDKEKEFGVMIYIGSTPEITSNGIIIPVYTSLFPIIDLENVRKAAEPNFKNKEVLDKIVTLVELFYTAMRLLAQQYRKKKNSSFFNGKHIPKKYLN
ncbi:hypothetical protein [Desulfurobacterium sp.]|uniref:hypothetical protein n=1 Tax=Desulfurobacterium sp. TaxID=2004706 RepID=UPI00261032F9|nr:hypothetical protein [Desulfurobacterium sp.]